MTVDDAASALLRFESGARGTMEVARAAVRRPCDFTVEVNGSQGTLVFSYARLNELWYGGADDDIRLYGMRRIRAEHPSHPYAAQWWPIGQGVGYGSSFANQAADLLEGWPDAPWTPGFPRRRRGPGGVRRDGDLGRLRPLGERQRGAREHAVTCAECPIRWPACAGTVYDIGRFTPARFAADAGGVAS